MSQSINMTEHMIKASADIIDGLEHGRRVSSFQVTWHIIVGRKEITRSSWSC